MPNDKEYVHICTWEDPWTPEKSKRAQHPYANCVYDGGWEQEYETDVCPVCGKRFNVEIPQ